MNRVHLNKRRPAGGRVRTSATERGRAQPSAAERAADPLFPSLSIDLEETVRLFSQPRQLEYFAGSRCEPGLVESRSVLDDSDPPILGR